MQWDEFQETAERLAQGATEGDWRSAMSRAYYAVFHYFRQFLLSQGLDIGRGGQSHNSLYVGLHNCGLTPLVTIANRINILRAKRTGADYDLSLAIGQPEAAATAKEARNLVSDFQSLLTTLSPASIVQETRGYLRSIGRLGKTP